MMRLVWLPRGGHLAWAAALCGLIAAGCGPDRGKKVGAFCTGDSDCQNGVCYNNVCLDPDGDEDGDNLKNGVEVSLNLDPFLSDTDGDGSPDGEEVVDVNQPADTDGDGLINAFESSLPTADHDGDCLPDQFDPDNGVFNADMNKLVSLFCLTEGVCQEWLAEIKATCAAGVVSCDYAGVGGFEEEESTCDDKDNDCDGSTDEDLTSTVEGICFDLGICGAAGAVIPRQCEQGVWVCKYVELEDWEEVESRIDGLDNDCDGETDEGWAGQPCEVENVHGICKGVTVFKDGAKDCSASEPATETCDNEDNDCDGDTDEDLTSDTLGDCATDGVCGAPGLTIKRNCVAGIWECQYDVVPGYEAVEVTCEGEDNNCDGNADEGLAGVACDLVNGFGTCPGQTQCDGAGGTECAGVEATAETCDGQDNDCDGDTDEDLTGNACDIVNIHGTCPGVALCDNATFTCQGTAAEEDVCDGADNNCDGETDEDEICLKTTTVVGLVTDGLSKGPITGVVVTAFPDVAGKRAEEEPAGEEITDAEGRFEMALKPGSHRVDVAATGYDPITTWVFGLAGQETMPLNVVLVPAGDPALFASVCGRVFDGPVESGGMPLAGASVTLYGNDFGNALASTTSGPDGFYCISGIPAVGADDQPFTTLSMAAKQSGYLPGQAENLPNLADTVLIVNLSLQSLPDDTVTLLDDDFESGSSGWTLDPTAEEVTWNLTQNGSHLNTALGNCVAAPAQNENCVPDPDDPADQCAVCVLPTDNACIPEPGALPNAYSGEHAFWFGNPGSNNFLPSDGSCENGNGGTGGPVGGSLVSPSVMVQGYTSLYLTFYSAFEIESQDPQAPPAGFDWMLVEVQLDGAGAWEMVGYLNPDIDANGLSYQPYSSSGFDSAPVWVNHTFDLSQWVGATTLQVRFRFESSDTNYNGFRGWLVDDVEIFGFGQG